MKIEPKNTDIVVPTIKTHNDGFSMWDVCSSSSLMGYIDISYVELVAQFGEPKEGDGYKVDAEWEISDGRRHATIYNYKDGPNYNVGAGSVESIRNWHIGGSGNRTHSVELLKDIFPNHTVRGADGY